LDFKAEDFKAGDFEVGDFKVEGFLNYKRRPTGTEVGGEEVEEAL
jgi:hypothetical protein